jgi:hypothetical protein
VETWGKNDEHALIFRCLDCDQCRFCLSPVITKGISSLDDTVGPLNTCLPSFNASTQFFEPNELGDAEYS